MSVSEVCSGFLYETNCGKGVRGLVALAAITALVVGILTLTGSAVMNSPGWAGVTAGAGGLTLMGLALAHCCCNRKEHRAQATTEEVEGGSAYAGGGIMSHWTVDNTQTT
jgi:hypothetical protein